MSGIQEQPKGLGGWLIIIQILLFLTLFYSLFVGFTLLIFGMFITFSLIIFIFLFSIVILFLFYRKSKKFIRLSLIWIWLVFVGFGLSSLIIPILIILSDPSFITSDFGYILESILSTIFYLVISILFTLYIKKSKRVKNTFVE